VWQESIAQAEYVPAYQGQQEERAKGKESRAGIRHRVAGLRRQGYAEGKALHAGQGRAGQGIDTYQDWIDVVGQRLPVWGLQQPHWSRRDGRRWDAPEPRARHRVTAFRRGAPLVRHSLRRQPTASTGNPQQAQTQNCWT